MRLDQVPPRLPTDEELAQTPPEKLPALLTLLRVEALNDFLPNLQRRLSLLKAWHREDPGLEAAKLEAKQFKALAELAVAENEKLRERERVLLAQIRRSIYGNGPSRLKKELTQILTDATLSAYK